MVKMTNEIFYMERAFLNHSKEALNQHKNNFEVLSHIKEFNTLEISLPRFCGKTEYIRTFMEERNATVFVANEKMAHYNFDGRAYSIEANFDRFRGRRNTFDFVYLDEVSVDKFWRKMQESGIIYSIINREMKIVSLLTK